MYIAWEPVGSVQISFVGNVLGLGSYSCVSNSFGVIMSKSCIYKSGQCSLSTALHFDQVSGPFFDCTSTCTVQKKLNEAECKYKINKQKPFSGKGCHLAICPSGPPNGTGSPKYHGWQNRFGRPSNCRTNVCSVVPEKPADAISDVLT